jgi:photosystem II stability/assembly factor-like uncharacterized protein
MLLTRVVRGKLVRFPSDRRCRPVPLLILLLLIPVLAHAQGLGARASRAPARTSSFHVYRSDDQGVSWTEVGEGLPKAARVHALAVEGSTAYAGTDDSVFVSVDGGRLWAARVMTPASPVQCFTIVGRRVYAGTRKAGVFVTEGGGRSWRRVADGLTDPNVRSLASRGSVVYAGTDSKGVFILPDGEERWTPFGRGLPERPQVFDLAVKGRHLYAALYSKGLYRLEAGGGPWERVGDVTPLRFLVRGDSLLAGHNPGGIYHSVDEGATWQLAAGLPGDSPIWVLGDAGPNVLAGTSPGGVSRSDDLGATWKPSAAGLPPGAAVVAVGDGQGLTLAAIFLRGGE